MPPARCRGQVYREASRLGDAGVIDPFPAQPSWNTGDTAAVFGEWTVSVAESVSHRENPDAAMSIAHGIAQSRQRWKCARQGLRYGDCADAIYTPSVYRLAVR